LPDQLGRVAGRLLVVRPAHRILARGDKLGTLAEDRVEQVQVNDHVLLAVQDAELYGTHQGVDSVGHVPHGRGQL
jgi:hypothetical protein